jgi:hypothetical protein
MESVNALPEKPASIPLFRTAHKVNISREGLFEWMLSKLLPPPGQAPLYIRVS